ncbi:hypothetical protein GCM10011360_23700 [Primorskyibacter flagellatus]|uniref:Uncharacterized protein n=1 Tax=Primorskyibacter flagellatus TaxID=1387277 RepID=A0A917EFZ2_9RHOB|nr:hypothetical protein GCM10011360_23700 [Primorskyibacter flagellatus]
MVPTEAVILGLDPRISPARVLRVEPEDDSGAGWQEILVSSPGLTCSDIRCVSIGIPVSLLRPAV